jgi:hypothetical protein
VADAAPAAQAEPAAAVGATGAKAKAEEEKEGNGGLPPGWKEVKHAATGQVRYGGAGVGGVLCGVGFGAGGKGDDTEAGSPPLDQ